jgi:hypothetical protein
MFHPSFAQPYRLRQGPADDESDEESHYGTRYARTPFPGVQELVRTPSSDGSEGIIPGGRPRCKHI